MGKVVIMPCLDIKDGRVVKGVHFVDLQDAGNPVLASQAYIRDGADELAFLDITATVEKRKTTLTAVRKVADVVNVPFTVGGGIGTVEDASAVLEAGADRVSISSAAFRNPGPIDVDKSNDVPSGYEVYIDGGRTPTGKDAIEWAKEAEQRGAGIILPTSKACDGAKQGYDIPLIRQLKDVLSVPVVASGGAGTMEHFLEAAQAGADILLAASVFHFGEIKIGHLKDYLRENGIDVG